MNPCECGKPSCLPPDYPPRCSRHYLQDLARDDQARARRHKTVTELLSAGKRDEALRAFRAPLSDYYPKSRRART